MKTVTEYKNYREYILDYYKERKRCSAFTWREFAKVAGFASGSYLKLVCDGKTRLREEGAKKTALAMGLLGYELDYFVLLVRYEGAKTEQEKKKCFEEMQALGEANRVKILGSEMYTYYETWKHSVVRELAVAMPGAKPNEIAKVCKPAISAADVSDSLRFLLKAGLLTRDIKGNYHQTSTSLSTGNLNVVAVAVHSLLRQMGEFALDALDKLPISERHFSGITMGMTAESYKKVVDEIAAFRKRIVSIVSADKKIEKVCRLNMQLFPLTEKIEYGDMDVLSKNRGE
ncbi:TIGR02147 family protein [Fibrobacter sp. UWB13]|uniref:TIGR02147 family protein n=1 Tax=Fibrobacter sp. UWB13 TaxID=1896204 RepID=UPI000A0D3192|nr:TIGR02147 family protein [Fibrobacter sp. UWB13]SMG40866.1 TIGR02147 family protein [Fibrobacter sp. UWB13]